MYDFNYFIFSGVDIIETAPSCHPLICLHSNIGQKQMETFLQELTRREGMESHLNVNGQNESTTICNVRNDSMLLFPP